MDIKVLGTGCTKCKNLENLTREVVSKNGIDATVTKVEDIMEIMKYDVMSTPAVVINEEVKIKGKIPSRTDLEDALINNLKVVGDDKNTCSCS